MTACAVLLVTTLTPVAARAAAVDPAAAEGAVLLRQEQIHAVTDRIWERVSGDARSGFAGVAQADDASSFTVYWKTPPPAWVTDLLAAPRVGPPGRIAPAAYSRQELTTAIERLLDRPPAGQAYRLAWVAGRHDGSGLTAGVTRPDPTGPVPPAMTDNEAVVSQARDDLTTRAAIPVVVTEARSRPGRGAWSRSNDQAPWKAGGARDGDDCSIGFAIRLSGGQVRLLSARHCGGGAGSTVRDGNYDVIGNVTIVEPDLDSQLIDPASTLAGYGWVFKGAWTSSSTIRVEGSTYSNVNDYVCTSGQMSGTHCNLRVINDNWFDADPEPGLPAGPYKLARAAAGSTGAGTFGDSGGAVYDPTASGGALATGIITGGLSEPAYVPCTTRSPTTVNVCGMEVAYISYMAILARWSAHTITG